jgi:hypothetical protein
MIPYVLAKGRILSEESKQIQNDDGSPPAAFRVFGLAMDCYVPDVGIPFSHSQVKKPNLTHYVSTNDVDQIAFLSSIPKNQEQQFRLAIFPKKPGKLRLVFMPPSK